MKHFYMQLHNKFGSKTVFNSWAADVKEMYDWLPQTDIIKAIKWILSYIAKKSQRTSVALFINARNEAGLEKVIYQMRL